MYQRNGVVPSNNKDETVALCSSIQESQKSSTDGSHVIYSSASETTHAYGHISVKLSQTLTMKGSQYLLDMGGRRARCGDNAKGPRGV